MQVFGVGDVGGGDHQDATSHPQVHPETTRGKYQCRPFCSAARGKDGLSLELLKFCHRDSLAQLLPQDVHFCDGAARHQGLEGKHDVFDFG